MEPGNLEMPQQHLVADYTACLADLRNGTT